MKKGEKEMEPVNPEAIEQLDQIHQAILPYVILGSLAIGSLYFLFIKDNIFHLVTLLLGGLFTLFAIEHVLYDIYTYGHVRFGFDLFFFIFFFSSFFIVALAFSKLSVIGSNVIHHTLDKIDKY